MEEEINLVDYAKVIFRKRWLIFFITIGCILLSIILTFFIQRYYSGSVFLEMGKMYFFENGKSYPFIFDSPQQVQKRINQRIYNGLIKKELDIKNILSVNAKVDKEENIIEIDVKTTFPEDGKRYIEALVKIVSSQNDIILIKNKQYLEKEIALEREKIELLEKNQNLSNLQTLYVEHLTRLNDMEASLNSIKETTILNSPYFNLASKTNLKLNIIFGLVLGLLFGIIIAFFVDFFQKNKKEILGK